MSGAGQNQGMKRTLLFVLALVAAVPVDGVAQDGLDSDTTVREFFDHLGAAVESLFEAVGSFFETLLDQPIGELFEFIRECFVFQIL